MRCGSEEMGQSNLRLNMRILTQLVVMIPLDRMCGCISYVMVRKEKNCISALAKGMRMTFKFVTFNMTIALFLERPGSLKNNRVAQRRSKRENDVAEEYYTQTPVMWP